MSITSLLQLCFDQLIVYKVVNHTEYDLMNMHLAKLLGCSVCILLQCIIFTGAQGEEIDCQNTAYGSSCALPTAPERTALIGDRLYVGITNELLAFQLRDQQLVDVDRVNLSPSVNRSNICEFDQLNDGALCENYIRVIQIIPEAAPAQSNELLVCGTNSFFPKCRLHDPIDLSNWIFMTPEDHDDYRFTPFANTRPNVGVLASNGRFFSATFFSAYGSERGIGMAPRPLEGDSTFTLETPSSNTRWLHRPDFVSVYEHGDHIYFFAREPAYEVDMGRTVAYSRAIRLCKNDDGRTDQTQTFLTFQKARITCTNNGGTNTIPYSYDNLNATYLWQSGSGEQILYGAFSAPEFGPKGTAICKFSFDDIARVFEDGLYLIPSAEDNNVWVRSTPGAFSCPGTSGQQRTDQHATDFQLVFNTINAMQPEPVHVVSGEEVTQIAVDFINYGGVENEILYYSTSRGETGFEIRQLVIDGSESYEHTILNMPAANAIRSLDVYQGDNEIRYLFLTTEDSVLSIPLGNCSRYTGCFSCLDSKDPYCGWDTTTSTPNCVNKLSTSNPLVESVSSTENMITERCGRRPATTPTQPPTQVPSLCPNTAPTEQPTDATGTSDGPPANRCTPSVEGLDNPESDESQISFSIPELVGSTVGGIVVGILIGLLVCGVFFKLFVKGRNDGKSEGSGVGTVHSENVPGTVHNNQFNVNVQKKEQALQNHYVDTQPVPPHPIMEEQPEKKDLNRYESAGEEDDAIAPLSSFQQNGHRSHRSPPKPRPKPTRNRTESTRELMGSVSSDPSDSVELSPLDSPV